MSDPAGTLLHDDPAERRTPLSKDRAHLTPRELGASLRAGPERVARVVVDVPLAHLDRPFDYAVPDAMAGEVRAGCRGRVRFAGQLVDGFVLELAESTEHGGKLAPLAKLVSPEPVLTPQVVASSEESRVGKEWRSR